MSIQDSWPACRRRRRPRRPGRCRTAARSLADEGWRPDPTKRHEHRFHDGTSWTKHVSDQRQATAQEEQAARDAQVAAYIAKHGRYEYAVRRTGADGLEKVMNDMAAGGWRVASVAAAAQMIVTFERIID